MQKENVKGEKKIMKTKEMKRRGTRGITLIALVVTIVVLLILAGITISTLTGDNGIITMSRKAKLETEIAEIAEKINLISNELMRPDCYMILKNGHITNFADKTNKTIRQAHNLEKMMLGGEFE